MANKNLNDDNNGRSRPGIVLLITLVILVVLSTLAYTLSSRVAAQRHRDQYIIDYSKARYGCDSAVKYALATLEEISPQLISRPNEPDFSDLFILSEAEYQELLAQWADESLAIQIDSGKSFDDMMDVNDFNDIDDANNTNDINDVSGDGVGIAGFNDFGSVTIRGPYGPPWPFVTEPVEFEVGSAQVRIEIEDENAKYPLGWTLLNDRQVKREAETGFQTFCELMGLDGEQIIALKEQLSNVGEIKPFQLNFRPITRSERVPIKARAPTSRSSSSPTSSLSTRPSASSRIIRAPAPTQIVRKSISVPQQITEQTTHFAKLFHSSLIDTEVIARPYIEGRKESALKYMGMWGSRKVNINTAPRHVLEAAFIFGGDQVEIAQEIILRRQIEPFADIEDLKRALLRYGASIGKCEKYITTVSTFFTIRVTAVSGVAKTSSVIAITKEGNKVQRIAVING
jgi:hypothetical protein